MTHLRYIKHLFTILAMFIVLYSCQKESPKNENIEMEEEFVCPELPCKFGDVTQIANQECSCICAKGFEGDSCEVNIANAQYRGNYQVIDSSLGHNRYKYYITIEATGNDNKIYMPAFREIYVPDPFYINVNLFQPIGIVDGNMLTMPFQTFDNGAITIEGNGTLDGTTLTLNYTLLYRGVEESCKAIFNRI